MKRSVPLFLILALIGCASAPAPRVSKAYGDLGKAKLVLNEDYQGAVTDFTRAIEFNPKDAQLYMLRGMAYRKQGDQESANADFKRAISLDASLKKALQPLMR